jgi:hypothetical protein
VNHRQYLSQDSASHHSAGSNLAKSILAYPSNIEHRAIAYQLRGHLDQGTHWTLFGKPILSMLESRGYTRHPVMFWMNVGGLAVLGIIGLALICWSVLMA